MSTTVNTALPTAHAPTSAAAAEAAIATQVAAFAADPVIRWLFPEPRQYLRRFPQLLRVLCAASFNDGTADVLDAGVGAALWIAPGVELPEEAAGEALLQWLPPDRHEMLFAFMGQVSEHHPDTPTWYLPFIGVDPREHGRGHGSTLLGRGLDRADRDGLPSYLEASSPRNRALYERHGFDTIAEIQVGDSPPLWPMLRTAR
jgi:GNAT superfamily N-acetyltransferase